MENAVQKIVEIPPKQKKIGFNFNKFQAIVCMAASAVVSIGLIIWAVKVIF